MSEQESIPPLCYELLEAIHEHGAPMPYRSLSAKLQDVGLLKVCRHHKLVELVLWYEPDRGPAVPTNVNIVVVESLPTWLPFHQMGRSSVREAVERDAECDDARRSLHVALTPKGDLTHETRRLSKGGGEATGDAGNRQGAPTTDHAELLISLRPSYKMAYMQRGHAQQHCSGLAPGQPGDKAAHGWLMEHGDEDEEKPVALNTWTRYLRAVRRRLGEMNPRRTRDHGPSVVRPDQVEPEYLLPRDDS